MPDPNVELFRRGYHAFARGDITSVGRLANYDDGEGEWNRINSMGKRNCAGQEEKADTMRRRSLSTDKLQANASRSRGRDRRQHERASDAYDA